MKTLEIMRSITLGVLFLGATTLLSSSLSFAGEANSQFSYEKHITVSTLAGQCTGDYPSYSDGRGRDARFSVPGGMAVDLAGNLYVADLQNYVIRKITSDGVVTTIAGSPTLRGSADGTGSNAQFDLPWGIAVGPSGNIYVADGGNNTIRKITPQGVVTTLAGVAKNAGHVDGKGASARFYNPIGIAVDNSENIYVSDGPTWYSGIDPKLYSIRKITPDGVVSTFVKNYSIFDHEMQSGDLSYPSALAVDSSGNIYVSGGGGLLKFNPSGEEMMFWDADGSPNSWGAIVVDTSGNIFKVSQPTSVAPSSGMIVKYSPKASDTGRTETSTTILAGKLVQFSLSRYLKNRDEDRASVIYDRDGSGKHAVFSDLSNMWWTPSAGIAIDRLTGNVYVAEACGSIRKIEVRN